MEGPTEDELDKLSAVGGKYKTKNQVHDRRGQVHSISCNFKSGQKLPLVVKYPRISRFYENYNVIMNGPNLEWESIMECLLFRIFRIRDNSAYLVSK